MPIVASTSHTQVLLARDKLEGVNPVAVLLADLAQNPHVKRHRSLEPLKRVLRCVGRSPEGACHASIRTS